MAWGLTVKVTNKANSSVLRRKQGTSLLNRVEIMGEFVKREN
jgi:hypothetical protein